jgi:hypothetical protein
MKAADLFAKGVSLGHLAFLASNSHRSVARLVGQPAGFTMNLNQGIWASGERRLNN